MEAVIGLRFVLRLLGANPDAAFVRWIYDVSTPLVAPFAGIFGQDAMIIANKGVVITSAFDWTALIALVVYGIIIGLVGRLLARMGV